MEGISCPLCGLAVSPVQPVVVGQRLVCPHCYTHLEVVEADPLELDWASEDPPLPWEDHYGVTAYPEDAPDQPFD